MKNLIVCSIALVLTGMFSASAQTSAELDKAVKSVKPVFMVAYNGTSQEVGKAFILAEGAAKKVAGGSVVVKLNTADAANKGLVTKYRLTGAPLPLIIVLDKNGTIAGGMSPKEATPEKLAAMVPTPKTSEILKAVAEGKSVYVVVSASSMSGRNTTFENCAQACRKLDNKSVTVKVDLADKSEAALLQNLQCNMNATEPVVYVLNNAGKVVGTHKGIADVNSLVSSAKKVPAGGCCPGGSKDGSCK